MVGLFVTPIYQDMNTSNALIEVFNQLNIYNLYKKLPRESRLTNHQSNNLPVYGSHSVK